MQDVRLDVSNWAHNEKALGAQGLSGRAGDRGRTGDVQLEPIAAPVEVTLFQPDEFYRVERGDSIGPLGCAATRAAGRSLQCHGS